MAEGCRIPEAKLSHGEALEIAGSLNEASGVVGFQPVGPVWTLLAAVGVIGAIAGAHLLAYRARIGAEERAREAARPPVAGMPPAPGAIRPTVITPPPPPPPAQQPAAAPAAKAPAPAAPPVASPELAALLGEGVTGFGLPGMPVMGAADRMAPPP